MESILNENERFYTPQEVAERYKTSVQSISVWTQNGTLRAIKVGKLVRIPESALADLEARTVRTVDA